MYVGQLLKGLNLTGGQVSIRKQDRIYGLTYLGGGSPERCIKRFEWRAVLGSCIVDNVLILYVD